MSSEPIEIRIQDQVDGSIGKKLDQIAQRALAGHANIERLKKALASIGATGVNRLAIEQQRLETAIARTATQQARQAAATSNAAAAQSRAASAALRLQQQQDRLAASTAKAAREGEMLKRDLFPLYAAHQQYNEAVARANRLHTQGSIDTQTYNAALARAKLQLESAAVAARSYNVAQQAIGRTAALNRAHLVNLGFQLQDVGQQLAVGQNPLIVLLQQGGQIAGIAGQAGIGIGRLAIEAGKMVSRFIPVAAVIGSVVAGMKLLASEATKGAGLAEFARSLGATREDIEEFNLDVVTLGDTFKGLLRTIDEATGIGALFSNLWEHTKTIFTNILKFVANTFNSIISLGRAAVETLVVSWQVLPNRIGLFFAETVNNASRMFEGLLNTVIDGVNTVVQAFNILNGTSIGLLENVSVGQIDTSQFQVLGTDLSQVFVDSYMRNMQDNQKALDGFIAEWQANSIEVARERIRRTVAESSKDAADGLKEINVEAKKLSTNLFDYLTPMQLVNRELKQQEELLQALPREREILQQMQQIENQLYSENVILLQSQRDALRQRLEAQQRMNIAQQSEAQIWENTRGARERYIADLEAINKLRAGGTITGGEAAQQIIQANPEFDFTGTQTMNEARLQQFADMYQKIDDMRQKDLISERTAAQLRMRVWVQEQENKLEHATTFFSTLATLAKSENKKLAAIGKAAAITQAIIDGVLAVQKALASAPPPINYALATAVGLATAANVAAIRNQGAGYAQGGYTGDIPRTAVAGAVHGQEYVMPADATARIGVANLEQLRRGAAGVQDIGGRAGQTVVAPPAQVNQKIVNVLDPSLVGQYMQTAEGEELVLNIIERNPQRVGSSVNGV